MSAAKDPNKKHYFNDLSFDDMKKEGVAFAEQQVEIYLWMEGQSEDNVETFKCIDFNPVSLTLTLQYQPSGLLSKLSKSALTNKDVFVKIGTGKSQTFTTSRLIYSNENKNYTITINNRIFRSIQRQNYRLSAGLKNEIQIKLGDGLIFDGLDISAGGMSFLIEVEKIDLYEKGMTFQDCTARLNRDRFEIEEVTIAGHWPQEEPNTEEIKHHKVGVAFSKLDPEEEERLFKIINSVARVEELTKSMLAKKKK